MNANDDVRQLLLNGEHESGDWLGLFQKIGQAEMHAIFTGDPMGNPQPWGMEIQPGQVVLPVFTHLELLRGNVPCPPGAWPDEVGIRQAASFAISKGWVGLYVNFRANGWLLHGDLLAAAAIGQLPAA